MLPGSIFMFAGSVIPAGFLLCDGSEVSRSTYATLFNIIGTTYGDGDGSTTFNLPDITGRVAIGVSLNHQLGNVGGEEAHTLSTLEIPAHGHIVPSHGHSNTIKATTPTLSHTITQPTFNYNRPNGTRASKTSSTGTFAGTTSSGATRSANLAIENHAPAACTKSGGITDRAAFDTLTSGNGTSHNNMQPFVALNYIIATGE